MYFFVPKSMVNDEWEEKRMPWNLDWSYEYYVCNIYSGLSAKKIEFEQ